MTENEQVGIVIKNRLGDDVTYYGVETVTFDTNIEGKQQTFTKGNLIGGVEIDLDFADGDQDVIVPEGYLVKQATIKKPETLIPENIREGETVAGIEGTLPAYEILENVPIALDFSAGNQSVTVPDGNVVKSAIIQQPETLIPENIAEGVDIAGIIGTLAAGASAKIAIGNCPYSISAETYTHNLGVIPDIIMLVPSNSVSLSQAASRTLMRFGVSSKFAAAFPSIPKNCRAYFSSNLSKYYWNAEQLTTTIDQAGSNIYNANETSFTVDSHGNSFTFIAIGGLT